MNELRKNLYDIRRQMIEKDEGSSRIGRYGVQKTKILRAILRDVFQKNKKNEKVLTSKIKFVQEYADKTNPNTNRKFSIKKSARCKSALSKPSSAIVKFTPFQKLSYDIEVKEQKKKAGPKAVFEEEFIPPSYIFVKPDNKVDEILLNKPEVNKSYNLNETTFMKSFRPKSTFKKNIINRESSEIFEKFDSIIEGIEKNSNIIKQNIQEYSKSGKDKDIGYKELFQYIRSKENLDLKRIVNELKLEQKHKIKKSSSEPEIDSEKIMEKNFKKAEKTLCEQYLKPLRLIYNTILYEDYKLNKKETVVNFAIQNYKSRIKQNEEFAEVAKERLILKKKYKGAQAVLPSSEENFFKKLIISNIPDFHSEDYFDDLKKKQNTLMKIKHVFDPTKKMTYVRPKKYKKFIFD